MPDPARRAGKRSFQNLLESVELVLWKRILKTGTMSFNPASGEPVVRTPAVPLSVC